jgi:hypothetical protein
LPLVVFARQRSELCWCARIILGTFATFRALLMFTNQLDTCNVQSSVDVNHLGNSRRSELCWCSQINLILATFRALLMCTNHLGTCNVQCSVDVHKSTWYLQRSELCWCARINLIKTQRRSELCWCAQMRHIHSRLSLMTLTSLRAHQHKALHDSIS